MSRERPRPRLLLLTEDSSKQADDVLEALAKEMLRLVEPRAQVYKLSFEPLKHTEARLAMRANHWRSRKPRDEQKIRELRRYIANILMQEQGFVLFHMDGDRRWSKPGEQEDKTRVFDERIRKPVEQLVLGELLKKQSAASLKDRLSRLRIVMPFYSIEAWVYQNTREAQRLCQEHYTGRDVEHFQAWAEDRTLLDEVHQPKEQVCLKDMHNLELATMGFPAREVYVAGKSFAAAVEGLKQCAELLQALARTAEG